MKLKVNLDGQKRISVEFGGFKVLTDQPVEDGGSGTAPAPFDLFLASMGACAGYFIQSFCQTRGISTEGIEIIETTERDEKTHLVSRVVFEVTLPASFPEKYRGSVVAAVNQCTVKRTLQAPPTIDVVVKAG